MRISSTCLALVLASSWTAPGLAFLQPPQQHHHHRSRFDASSTQRWTSTLEEEDTKTATAPSTSRTNTEQQQSLGDRIANSGVASAAAMATAAVNAAVAMKSLEAPDVTKSYIALDHNNNKKNAAMMDEEGLPLVYDKQLIEAYWSKERGALNQRWGQFVAKAVPFLTKLVTLFIKDGKIKDVEIPALSRQARLDLQDLGPTFIKAGQMMSVRPDVLPQSTLDELTKLQDAVVPFDTPTAVQQIERELGGPLGQFFGSISEKPVAAASLAQVYKATLLDEAATPVAIKVQRPDVLGTVSKDLYVLRRAAEVFQGLVERFAPQQRTNYVALLNEWAIGFYSELDFQNEASNQKMLRTMLMERNVTGVMVPAVYEELCTRRILVSEWVDGIKLSEASPEQIADVTPDAQEAFLTQLFEPGIPFHADPHPGNLLLLNEPTDTGAKLALIDCGLMANIPEQDRDNMISAVIHLANKDYAALVDDFILLEILPADTNRATVIPLMDKALSPYVKGGGAKRYEQEVRKLYGMQDGSTMQSQVGGFQAMTQDALTVLEQVPFSIPPYFAILGRAIVTLEGVALSGNENYGIIMESYPFIARKLLREGRPEIQKALQEVLYSSGTSSSGGGGESSSLKLTRLLALLNNAAGAVATQEGAAFVDLDAIPEDGISLQDGLKYLLSDDAASLRNLLESEMDHVVDVLSRQLIRRAVNEAVVTLTPPRPPALPFVGDIFPPTPALDEIPLPILLPGSLTSLSSLPQQQQDNGLGGGRPSIGVMTLKELIDVAAPPLGQDEEVFAIGLAEGAGEFFGEEIGDLIKGERVFSAESVDLTLQALRSGVLGQPNIVSRETADTVIENVQNALNLIRQRPGGTTSASGNLRSSISNSETGFTQVLESLSNGERERFDSIVNELTQRAMQRIIGRLSTIERLI